MSGDRQWTIGLVPHWPDRCVDSGPALAPGEYVDVVEASRLTAVEAERDALLEVVEWVNGGFIPGADRATYNGPDRFLDEVKQRTAAVLARFPKNETEQEK